jgi:uncharacterized protein (TIGR02145 family)
MNKQSIITAAIALALELTPVAFAANLSKNCTQELTDIIEEEDFDMKDFIKELAPAVVKAKAQAKMSFGKPKDSEETDIGITFGCLKTFPESPSEIQSLLKDAGLTLLTDAADEGIAAALNSGEAKSLKNGAAKLLKECTSVFNPDKKFCYDGAVYDKCDGMEYNPTTHICSGYVANVAKCNDIAYNPLKQRCKKGIIETKCGTDWHNSATLFCYENEAWDKCGGKEYDPANQRCQNNVIESILIYGGQTYKTVVIGNQTWMAENLNYNSDDSECYNDDARNCEKCGRLYDWQEAKTACPKGWHLPSDTEWKALEKAVGGSIAGGVLKSKSGWNENGNGTDKHDFSALPCGRVNVDEVFDNFGDYANFWSATENGKPNAFGVYLSAEKALMGKSYYYNKAIMNSVRCVQDIEEKVSAQPENRVQSKPTQEQSPTSENFTAGQRFATWALNTTLSGIGSAIIMEDYVGMGIQIGLNALGAISVIALGFEERCSSYGYYGSSYYCTIETTGFFYIGIALLSGNAIYNIVRSASYDKPSSTASNGYSGFNLAVLPNKRGEFMPYVMYNKTF